MNEKPPLSTYFYDHLGGDISLQVIPLPADVKTIIDEFAECNNFDETDSRYAALSDLGRETMYTSGLGYNSDLFKAVNLRRVKSDKYRRIRSIADLNEILPARLVRATASGWQAWSDYIGVEDGQWLSWTSLPILDPRSLNQNTHAGRMVNGLNNLLIVNTEHLLERKLLI